MRKIIKITFILEIIIVFFMIMGIVPIEFSYFIILLFIIGFIKLKLRDSLILTILSIPFFTALPINQFSDSMSVWRIVAVFLFLKLVYENFKNAKNSKNKLKEAEYPKNKSTDVLRNKFTCQTKNYIKDFPRFLFHKLRKIKSESYYQLFLFVSAFLFLAVLSLFSAHDKEIGIKKILFFINIFLLFPVVIYSIKKEKHFVEILKVIFYSSSLVVLIGYFQFISTFFVSLFDFWQFWANNIIPIFYGQNLSSLLLHSNTWFSYYENLPPILRMFSVFPDSHSFAMFVIISLPAVFFQIFYFKARKKKIFAAFSSALFLMAVFFSGSRGSWVASVFALVFSLSLYAPYKFKSVKPYLLKIKTSFESKKNSKLVICSILLFFALIPLSSFVLKQNQETQISKSGESNNFDIKKEHALFERAVSISNFSETSNKGRLQIWKESLISIGEHPFFGVGFGNFPVVINENMSNAKKGASAHSIYFDIASEIGIFGLMVFLLLVSEILQTAYNTFFSSEKMFAKIFAGLFFAYFAWISAYGLFDVVIINDKVLIMTTIMTGVLYSTRQI